MTPHDSEQARWFVDEVLPHEKELRAWLQSRFPRAGDVDDLVQEAFTRLLKAHESGPVVNPRAYLFVITRNLALNQLRHLRYERPPDVEEMDPLSIADDVNSPPESIAKKEELQQLIKAIQSLPNRCRQVMTLRKIYGLSQKEVAVRNAFGDDDYIPVLANPDGQVAVFRNPNPKEFFLTNTFSF